MNPLALHAAHAAIGARFDNLNGSELVLDYGDVPGEHAALHKTAGILDLSFRGRICLTGADRVRFLHGQVTNDVKRLRQGQGCYATLVTAKGKMESDLSVYCLPEELLLDFEPGLEEAISERLEKYIVADDVQLVDVGTHYGMLSAQGPAAGAVIRGLGLVDELPAGPFDFLRIADAANGELFLTNHARLRSSGYDLFVPAAALGSLLEKMIAAAKSIGGRACGWQAFEIARIEACVPRFGADMGSENIPLESGIEARAVSYNKGCYIGQEVINRIHTIGHVTKELRGLRLEDNLGALPVSGSKLFLGDREVGYTTSAAKSPTLEANLALGYVRREASQIGAVLALRSADGESRVVVAALPEDGKWHGDLCS